MARTENRNRTKKTDTAAPPKTTPRRNSGPVPAAHQATATATQTAADTPTNSPGRPDGAAGAVRDALNANPGATVTQIADTAHVSRSTATKTLTALEAAGHATRTPGTRSSGKRTPDHWQPATDTGDQTGEPTPVPDSAAATAQAAPADGDAPNLADDSTKDASGDDAPAADPAGNGAAPTPRADASVANPSAQEAARVLAELTAAVTSASHALASGEVAAALPLVEDLYTGAAKARRLTKSAATRRVTGNGGDRAQPGQLRDRVRTHLGAHSGKDFTPYEVGRALGNSAGAVANALDRLVELGEAVMTCERPRRFGTVHGTDAGG